MNTQTLIINDQNEYIWVPDDGRGGHVEPLMERMTFQELIDWLPSADEFIGNIVVKEQSYPGDWAVGATFANDEDGEYEITFRYITEDED